MFLPNINSMHAGKIDRDLQTQPSEGPNTSSVWVWRKSVQHFPRYFIHKQKKSQHQKQSLTQFTACGNYVHIEHLLTIPNNMFHHDRTICACSCSLKGRTKRRIWARPVKPNSIMSRYSAREPSWSV